MGTQLPLKRKEHSSPPIFGPCLLWPNGWMDQDATWYGGRSRPWSLCVRWSPRFRSVSTVAKRWPISATAEQLFGKTTPYGEIFKILLWKDSSRHWPKCCVEISWNLADGKSVKSWNRALFTGQRKQKFTWLCSFRCCGDRARNLSGPAAEKALKTLEISSKSVHFRRSYSRTREHHHSALQSVSNVRLSLKPSFEPNNVCNEF